MDTISEARLRDVHPVLASKVRTMAAILAKEQIHIRVVQAWRTVAEQNALFAQGRTTAGPIVTNCPGGHSYHNYGLAVDCVPSLPERDDSFAPDWNKNHPIWKRMVAVGESLGLNCGADWRTFKDFPHFQLTGVFPVGHPPESLLALYASGNLQAVWDAAKIDARGAANVGSSGAAG
jgi:peptidoglycan L-alanyl-D-glutamate endopeptidase CwlK